MHIGGAIVSTKEERKAQAEEAVKIIDVALAKMDPAEKEAIQKFIDWLRENRACGYRNLLIPFIYNGHLSKEE